MGFTDAVKNNASLKRIIHRLLIPAGQARPRTWVKWFVNPFLHPKKHGSIVRRRVRLDVFPFNRFEMGRNAVIEDFCTVNNGVGDVLIGNDATIGMSNVLIGPVQIGNNVIIAQNVVISGLNHNYEDVNLPIQAQGVRTAPIMVEDDCWIGANAVITAGITVGKHSIIAAGAVVTKNVPAFCIAAGNPARIIKRYDATQKAWVKVI
ncbi:acyltransferase [Mucilaginibacter sp.]|uniref:acyltransferase n=1 Tax=Mucilaginibacter sp. TaxID=1882438 RepID=UPI003B00B768